MPLIVRRSFSETKSAEGRNRTGDTMIFSHVLYRLSYLGTSRYSSHLSAGGVTIAGRKGP